MKSKQAIAIAIALLICIAGVIWITLGEKPQIRVSGKPEILQWAEKSGTTSPQDLAEIRRVALRQIRHQNLDSLRATKGRNIRNFLKSYLAPGLCDINYQSDRVVWVQFGKPPTNSQSASWWTSTREMKGTNGWQVYFVIYD